MNIVIGLVIIYMYSNLEELLLKAANWENVPGNLTFTVKILIKVS